MECASKQWSGKRRLQARHSRHLKHASQMLIEGASQLVHRLAAAVAAATEGAVCRFRWSCSLCSWCCCWCCCSYRRIQDNSSSSVGWL